MKSWILKLSTTATVILVLHITTCKFSFFYLRDYSLNENLKVVLREFSFFLISFTSENEKHVMWNKTLPALFPFFCGNKFFFNSLFSLHLILEKAFKFLMRIGILERISFFSKERMRQVFSFKVPNLSRKTEIKFFLESFGVNLKTKIR